MVDFNQTGSSDRSNWDVNNSDFSKIVNAMSECSLKKSMECIRINECGSMKLDEIVYTLVVNLMGHLNVEYYYTTPYWFKTAKINSQMLDIMIQ